MNNVLPTVLICALIIGISWTATGQQKAEEILTKLQNTYPAEDCLHVEFTLTYQQPDGMSKSLEGEAWRMDDKYRIELPDQWIVTDGNTVWNYLRDIDEIHIEDRNGEENDFNPVNFMSLYQKAGFVPGLTLSETGPEGKRQHISFKPQDKQSDIVKARLEIVKGIPRDVFVFYRNGMKTHIEIHSIHKLSSPEEDTFELDPSDFPEAYVEDLRMD